MSAGLPVAEFPFAGPADGLLAAVSARAKSKAGGLVPATGRRLIVFVLGGMTFSELRAVHEVSRSTGREILVGATAMLTPQTYLVALRAMKQLDQTAV